MFVFQMNPEELASKLNDSSSDFTISSELLVSAEIDSEVWLFHSGAKLRKHSPSSNQKLEIKHNWYKKSPDLWRIQSYARNGEDLVIALLSIFI